jgi:DNA polymerase I-like protein with 3'-5' exonuclease and polymerase domains
MTTLYLDIETDLAHKRIWCAGYSVDGGPAEITQYAQTVKDLLTVADTVVGHNIVGFDAPVLERVWGIKIPPKKMLDTLLLSRLWNPSLDDGHSLDAWGQRLRYPKGDFRDYDAGYSEEMALYCKNDIGLTVELHKYLEKALSSDGFSEDCRVLERNVAYVIEKQVRNGFMFDRQAGEALNNKVLTRMAEIEAQFQVMFPPRLVELWSLKTQKPLKPYEEVFNLGARQQVVERLFELGVGSQLADRTETGKYKLSEEVLDTIDIPEAKLVVEFLTLQKRSSQIEQWLKYCTDKGRIHGRVITNGAVTGRMTHQSPNMAQVPNAGAYMGKDCRALFIVPEGKKLVGIDASALELCMLAHYMRDEDFTKSVSEGTKEQGTDVHTRNMRAAGLDTRDQAKTFCYALLYGAGPGKIGSIVNGGYAEGQQLMSRFMASMPKFAQLKSKVDRIASTGWLPGLDGRQMRIRSAHSALNTLLQGAGAIVMKKALVILHNELTKAKMDALFVVNVHDEWQLECSEEHAELVGKIGVEAIKEAGRQLGLRCPLDGEYKVGNSWKETH